MSSTASAALANVRALLNEQVGSRFTRNNEQVRKIMSNMMQLVAAESYGGLTKQTTACTLVAGTDTYTVAPSASSVMDSVVALVRVSDKMPLRKVAFDDMLELKRGNSAAQGKPDRYALYEDDSQVVKVVVHPTPGEADTLDAWYTDLPTELTDDSSTIPLGPYGVKALELLTAAELVTMMTDEELAANRLRPEIAGKWNDTGRRMLDLERNRTARVAQAGGVLRRYY